MALQRQTEIAGEVVADQYAVVVSILLDKTRAHAIVSIFDNKEQRLEALGLPPQQRHYDFPLSVVEGVPYAAVYKWLKLKEEYAGWADV
jgi:hypothetical protein